MNASQEMVWQVLESMQGAIAAEIRVMLGESVLPESLFTEEQHQRRIAALQQCASFEYTDEQRHEAWMQMHIDGGWVYGPQFDPVNKVHPNLLPWDQLPVSTRSKARIFAIVAKAGLAITNALDQS